MCKKSIGLSSLFSPTISGNRYCYFLWVNSSNHSTQSKQVENVCERRRKTAEQLNPAKRWSCHSLVIIKMIKNFPLLLPALSINLIQLFSLRSLLCFADLFSAASHYTRAVCLWFHNPLSSPLSPPFNSSLKIYTFSIDTTTTMSGKKGIRMWRMLSWHLQKDKVRANVK